MKAPTRQEQGYRLSSGTFRRLMAREGTEDNDIRHRVTADTVAAVDPAHHFTGGVGAANRLLRHIQHFAIGINGHAAHGVVHPGGDANSVERAFVNRRAQRGGPAKLFIMLFFHAPL